MHLVIDGYGGDSAKMWDSNRVLEFLVETPARLGMTTITEPKVLEYNAPKPEDSGVSGFVIIAESHISVHTFPSRSYVNIDIFSCRAFDQDILLEAAKGLFELDHVKTWILDRGLEWLDARQGLFEAEGQRAALGTGGAGQYRV